VAGGEERAVRLAYVTSRVWRVCGTMARVFVVKQPGRVPGGEYSGYPYLLLEQIDPVTTVRTGATAQNGVTYEEFELNFNHRTG